MFAVECSRSNFNLKNQLHWKIIFFFVNITWIILRIGSNWISFIQFESVFNIKNEKNQKPIKWACFTVVVVSKPSNSISHIACIYQQVRWRNKLRTWIIISNLRLYFYFQDEPREILGIANAHGAITTTIVGGWW